MEEDVQGFREVIQSVKGIDKREIFSKIENIQVLLEQSVKNIETKINLNKEQIEKNSPIVENLDSNFQEFAKKTNEKLKDNQKLLV